MLPLIYVGCWLPAAWWLLAAGYPVASCTALQVCCSGRVAAVSTVVTVVAHASAVCTIAVAVGVIVTVMYPLCKHGMNVVIAIDNVDMTRTLIIYCLCYCCLFFSVI